MAQKVYEKVDEVENSHPEPTDPVYGRAISVNILKGGAGKTPISLNLADRLSARGNKTLYMDLDPNGHVSNGLGFDNVRTDPDHSLSSILLDGEKNFGEVIYRTDWGFDFVPASNTMEDLNTSLKNAAHGSTRLRDNFLRPLIEGDHYDYVVMDGGGERSKIADNAFAAARQTIIPMEPGKECMSGFQTTFERVINPLRQYQWFNILAIVPTKIQGRIDHQNNDRELIEYLNTEYPERVPDFARITAEEFEQIDSGDLRPLPKPGLRKDADFTNAYKQGMPLAHYNPESDTIPHLDELAEIVENGGIQR